MQIFLAIIGFLLFIGLVVFHEWGHYIAARRSGVVVEEFGLGLPPRAYSKRRKDGMLLSLNWLPLGGFVKLKGEHDADKSKGSYGAATLGGKTLIMLAGVTMNLLAGLVLLTILAFIGLPKLIDDQFTVSSDTKISRSEVRIGVADNSPAKQAGLIDNDQVGKISLANGCVGANTCGQSTRIIKTKTDLEHATRQFAGQTVNITIQRKVQDKLVTQVKQAKLVPLTTAVAGLYKNAGLDSKTVTLKSLTLDNVTRDVSTPGQFYDAAKEFANGMPSLTYVVNGKTLVKQVDLSPSGFLGVIPNELIVRRSTWSSPIVAVVFTKQIAVLTFKGLGTAVKGLGSTIAGLVTINKEARQNGQTKATEQTGGPLAIVKIIWESGTLGANFMLLVIAIVSLTLAIMNVLPIPALDGGRLFVTYIYRALKRPLTQTAEERIHGTGMAVLLVLFALITIVDVKRFY